MIRRPCASVLVRCTHRDGRSTGPTREVIVVDGSFVGDWVPALPPPRSLPSSARLSAPICSVRIPEPPPNSGDAGRVAVVGGIGDAGRVPFAGPCAEKRGFVICLRLSDADADADAESESESESESGSSSGWGPGLWSRSVSLGPTGRQSYSKHTTT